MKRSYKILHYSVSLLVLILLAAAFAFGQEGHALLCIVAGAIVPPVIGGMDGEENMGGFKNFVVFIPDSIILSEPSLPESPASFEDHVVGKGKFSFKADGKPIYCYSTPGEVDFKPGTQGEIDGKSFNQKGEWFHPAAARKSVMALSRYLNNRSGRVILETSDGVQLMVGQEGLPANISASGDYGKAAKDRRGFKFEFVTDSFVPAIVLEGESKLNILDIKNGGDGLSDALNA
jgi:hypothetical protein